MGPAGMAGGPPAVAPRPTYRGTSNSNERGNSEDRRRRRRWLVETFRADVDVMFVPDWPRGAAARRLRALRVAADGGRVPDRMVEVPPGKGEPACRCYRCGDLLTVDTVSPDRIIPGCEGGTYKRNNIRPACDRCQETTGGVLGNLRKRRRSNTTHQEGRS